MSIRPIALFAAGFVAGGIVLGGVVAHARIVTLNASVAGVLPNSGGSMFCATASAAVRGVRGVFREVSVSAPGNTVSWGVELRCPA